LYGRNSDTWIDCENEYRRYESHTSIN
jgi:hypothetical protein